MKESEIWGENPRYPTIVNKRAKKQSGRDNSFRIIGGEWRGRRCAFADNPAIRPTPDRVRETLFNWLQASIGGAVCADLFAGSGALGLEALSRGAKQLTFVEKDRASARQIQQLVNDFNSQTSANISQADAWCWQPAEPLDILFADPPFESEAVNAWLAELVNKSFLREGGYLYLEQPVGRSNLSWPAELSLVREKQAGQVAYRLLKYTAVTTNEEG